MIQLNQIRNNNISIITYFLRKCFKNQVVFALFLGCIFTIASCDRSYDIKLNNEIKQTINFKCGSVDIYGRSLGKREFVIVQKYNNTLGKTTIYKDSLEIMYRNQAIPYEFSLSKLPLEAKHIIDNNDPEIHLRFNIPGGIEFGESIEINTKGFIYCNDHKISVGNVRIQLVE